jgi:hypothetical protein
MNFGRAERVRETGFSGVSGPPGGAREVSRMNKNSLWTFDVNSFTISGGHDRTVGLEGGSEPCRQVI